jgi:GDP-L-fucose synthase
VSTFGGVLITGGSGFLGRAVTQAIPGSLSLSSSDVDLTSSSDTAQLIGDVRPEVIVHLAARVGGITTNLSRPADLLVDNLRIDANLLAAIRQHPPRYVIAALSTCMYPDRLADDAYPMSEELIEAGPPPPSNAAYASAKRALWHGIQALHDQYGIPYTALVPSNLFGPGDHYGEESSHFLAAAIHKVEQARSTGAAEVAFFGNGTALRQFLLVDDVARLIALLIDKEPLNATLNVAPQHNQTIRQLAEAVAAVAGLRGTVCFTGTGPDGQHRKDVSTEMLRQAVPEWSDLETPLEAGIALSLDWYRTHVVSR